MKSARILLGAILATTCLALFSGCETQQAACEREKRLYERMDELEMSMDNRVQGMNSEFAAFRANPPVVVQQVPTPMPTPMPDYNAPPYAPSSATSTYSSTSTTYNTIPSSMSVDTISIEDDFYSMNKKQQLEQLAASTRSSSYSEPAPRKKASASKSVNHIRVPVPARTVQAALKEAGYYKGNVDGKIGKQTIAAITAFQRDNGLKADGIVGKQTWNLLYPYVPAGMSTSRLK